MQGVQLCSSMDQGKRSVWLEGELRAGQCLETLVERLLARGSLAVDSSFLGPRGGPKKKIEVRTREFQS